VDYLHVGAIWLHTVAFVIAWGWYGILSRVVIPGLARSFGPAEQASALASMERRALPLVLISVALFFLTGAYLLLVDDSYVGLGNLSNSWAMLMLLKHLVVVILIVVGVAIDALIRMAADPADDADRVSSLRLARWGAEAATGLGALIALLTAAAQLSV
jgi:uncharacterized membrane protein